MSRVSTAQALQTALQFHQLGRFPHAEMLYREILSREPENVSALHLLGVLLHQKGLNGEARELIEKALSLKEGFPEAHCNLGIVLQAMGKLNEAIPHFQRAVALKPNYVEGHYNLGCAYKDDSQFKEAFVEFQKAIDLNPQHHGAYNNLAILLRFSGRPEESLAVCNTAVRLNPRSHETYMNLGSAYVEMAMLEDAFAAFRKSIALKPDYASAHDALVFNLFFDPAQSPQAIIEQHVRWAENCAAQFTRKIAPHANDRSPDRQLRIGLVSPDFRLHAVSFFLLPLLESLDRTKYHVSCYYNQSAVDDITRRVQAASDQFCMIRGSTDDQVAAQIREDRIDILIDLAGHSADARLLVFARKPAPVQMTWLGYPGTTGLATIDYRITDGLADPDVLGEAAAPEKLLRLAHSAWCFSPLGLEPAIGPAPVAQRGFVTFGTFNRLAKVSRINLEMWAEILAKVPGSHLLLKNGAFQSKPARDNIVDFFKNRGVCAERIELGEWRSAVYDHREAYNRLDISLDTFPYHGTTTTCESLFMGVPVVTLAGNQHVSRVGASLLTNVGLAEMVAKTREEYIRIAIDLAGDRGRLADLRGHLRERMKHSALMNAGQFASEFQGALRAAWMRWCQ